MSYVEKEIVGYLLKTRFPDKQVLYVKVKVQDYCDTTFTKGPATTFIRKATREEAENLLRRGL